MSFTCSKWRLPSFFKWKYGIKVDPKKLAAILDRSVPKTTSEIYKFVSATKYLRYLIKKF